jgi:RNA polymerase sigma-70 factor (ECF subfamily)
MGRDLDREDLVGLAMAGDLEAFTELGRRWIDRLYAVACLILRDSEMAADATQEALIAAWRDLAGLRDPTRFGAWIHRLLVHACYREARRTRRRHIIAVQAIQSTDEWPDPAVALADRDQMERAFEHLTSEQRALLVLHYYLGLPMHETALALSLPVGTVKSRLFRITQQLRATLDADARLPLVEGKVT